MLFVRVKGFVDDGVKDYGYIVFEKGKFRTIGDTRRLDWILKQKIRDPSAGKERFKRLTVKDGEKFLRILPRYFFGSRLTAGDVSAAEKLPLIES